MEEKNKRIIVGIDISTTCTGVSIVSYDGEEIKVLYIDRIKFKSSRKIKGTELLFFKSKQFRERFIEKIKDSGITDIIIEEPLPNSQNLETVNSLLKFNGMLSQSIYEATGIVPKYISSYDARKYAFPDLMAIRKYNKEDEPYTLKKLEENLKHSHLVLFGGFPFACQKKFIIWNRISELYPDIKWVYDKKGELKTENFDASDSLVCILGYLNKERYGDLNCEVIKYKITNKDIKYQMKYWNHVIDKRIEL